MLASRTCPYCRKSSPVRVLRTEPRKPGPGGVATVRRVLQCKATFGGCGREWADRPDSLRPCAVANRVVHFRAQRRG